MVTIHDNVQLLNVVFFYVKCRLVPCGDGLINQNE